jgi:hypothetical protein
MHLADHIWQIVCCNRIVAHIGRDNFCRQLDEQISAVVFGYFCHCLVPTFSIKQAVYRRSKSIAIQSPFRMIGRKAISPNFTLQKLQNLIERGLLETFGMGRKRVIDAEACRCWLWSEALNVPRGGKRTLTAVITNDRQGAESR